MSKINVVITGATGFVGQHLLEGIDYTKWNVRILSRNFEKIGWADMQHCEKVKADLSDVNSLLKAFTDQDIIINIAAEIRDTAKMEASNIQGVKNLIFAARECGVKQIVHLSSVGVVGMQYASHSVMVDESFPCAPKNKYESTKLVSEQLLKEFASASDVSLSILRPTNVIGEHHPFNALLNLSLQLKKGLPALYTKGAKVNYVYVKDVVDAILQATTEQEAFTTRTLGASYSLYDFYKILGEAMSIKIRFVRIPSLLVTLLNIFGIKKLNAISNKVEYSTQGSLMNYNLEKGIHRTIDFYKQSDSL